MKARLVDTHAHLDMSEFDTDREDVLQRAVSAGVDTIVTMGTDLSSSRKAIALAENHAGIYAAVGFHPQDAKFMQPGDIAELKKLAQHPGVRAIGEIGLDYYRMKSPKDVQVQVLKRQLEIAAEIGMPVVIHSRQADTDMLVLMGRWAASIDKAAMPSPGVIHCFNGDINAAKCYQDMGFYIAFGAYTGYPSSRLADVIRSISPERLLLETDCPFLPPQSLRGQRE